MKNKLAKSCKFCNRTSSSKIGIAVHEARCVKNPNSVKYMLNHAKQQEAPKVDASFAAKLIDSLGWEILAVDSPKETMIVRIPIRTV